MNVDVIHLRRFIPLAVFVATVGLGWLVLVRPLSAEYTQGEGRLAGLQQREAALRAMVTEPPAPAVIDDPVAAFERRIPSDDPTAVIVERLARLAGDFRARDLFIETVEGTTATGGGAPPLPETYRPDPRFALFDLQLVYTTIKMSFETDYAALGRFLWNLRDLPSVVEIRAFNVQPRLPASGEAPPAPDGALRVSLTLYAYSRPPAPAAKVTP
jgi:hypothetical protein